MTRNLVSVCSPFLFWHKKALQRTRYMLCYNLAMPAASLDVTPSKKSSAERIDVSDSSSSCSMERRSPKSGDLLQLTGTKRKLCFPDTTSAICAKQNKKARHVKNQRNTCALDKVFESTMESKSLMQLASTVLPPLNAKISGRAYSMRQIAHGWWFWILKRIGYGCYVLILVSTVLCYLDKRVRINFQYLNYTLNHSANQKSNRSGISHCAVDCLSLVCDALMKLQLLFDVSIYSIMKTMKIPPFVGFLFVLSDRLHFLAALDWGCPGPVTLLKCLCETAVPGFLRRQH